jgi:DNA-binding protein HU-beta
MAATKARRLTQTEIVNQLAEKSGMKKADVKRMLDELVSLAASEVKKNGEFTLPGFGKLVKATRKAREGRNPATGNPIKIPAKTTVKFRLGKAMKDAVGLYGDPNKPKDPKR